MLVSPLAVLRDRRGRENERIRSVETTKLGAWCIFLSDDRLVLTEMPVGNIVLIRHELSVIAVFVWLVLSRRFSQVVSQK